MNPKQIKLVRRQLDETLAQLRSLRSLYPPRRGWIRAIRESLGMTGEQLARRIGTNRQRISRIEQDETRGKLTFGTLHKVAEALDCTLVYGLIPRHSLEQTVRQQAGWLARRRLERSNQMMRLEKQELGREEKDRLLGELVQEIMDQMPRALWEDR
jgi:predicted DNA-binding mobile mystery protein A